MNEIIPTQELQVYRQQLEVAEKYSTTLDVKTDGDYQGALSEGKKIKEQLEIIAKRKDEIIKPINTSLKSIKALFAPFEEVGENALKAIRVKMLAFATKQEDKANAKIDKIMDKYEAGKIGEGEANAKIFMAQPQKTVTTDEGSATIRKVKKYYVTDKSLVPQQFLDVDMVKVRASFKAGTPVPGVEERLESELALK